LRFFSRICEQNRDCEHSSKASFPVQEKIEETAKKINGVEKSQFSQGLKAKKAKKSLLDWEHLL